MHDQKHLIIHQSQRNLPDLAIVHPVIDHGQYRPLKDQRRIKHIYAVFLYALLALVFIPFEFQWKLSLIWPPSGALFVHEKCTLCKSPGFGQGSGWVQQCFLM